MPKDTELHYDIRLHNLGDAIEYEAFTKAKELGISFDDVLCEMQFSINYWTDYCWENSEWLEPYFDHDEAFYKAQVEEYQKAKKRRAKAYSLLGGYEAGVFNLTQEQKDQLNAMASS